MNYGSFALIFQYFRYFKVIRTYFPRNLVYWRLIIFELCDCLGYKRWFSRFLRYWAISFHYIFGLLVLRLYYSRIIGYSTQYSQRISGVYEIQSTFFNKVWLFHSDFPGFLAIEDWYSMNIRDLYVYRMDYSRI